MENEFDTRIHAYLNQEMTPAEQQAFEADLQARPDLQKAFEAQLKIEKALNAFGAWRLHSIRNDLRQKLGPLPEPKVSWFDKLRFLAGWFKAGSRPFSPENTWFNRLRSFTVIYPWRMALATGSLILVGLLIYANLGPARSEYRFEPQVPDMAGESQQLMMEEKVDFVKSARFYGSKPIQVDSLVKQMADSKSFSMAEYYLAHLDLENSRYEQAVAKFRHCLDQKNYILKFPEMQQEIPKIRLNLILAQLGAGQKSFEVMPDLDALINETSPEKDVHKNAVSLRRQLKNPLRFLR